jgi:hypothetical protein
LQFRYGRIAELGGRQPVGFRAKNLDNKQFRPTPPGPSYPATLKHLPSKAEPSAKRALHRTLLTALIVVTLGCGGTMADSLAEEPARKWHTDKVTFLDSPEFVSSTIRILNGALPGTGKPFDAQKVSDDLVQMLFAELQDQHGIHAETVLATLGALAGFSVQMALRETLVKPGKMLEDKVFVIVETKTGERFYLGDSSNEGLFGGNPGVYSVYAMVAGGSQKAGAKELPNINDIVGYIAKTLGSDKFGIPRVPAGHMPHASPISLLDKFWNPVRNFMVISVQAPLQWPLVLGLVAQKVIVMGKDSVEPAMAGRLVMETAVAMAKIDPANVHYAYFQT